jgi:hypothetical protein
MGYLLLVTRHAAAKTNPVARIISSMVALAPTALNKFRSCVPVEIKQPLPILLSAEDEDPVEMDAPISEVTESGSEIPEGSTITPF